MSANLAVASASRLFAETAKPTLFRGGSGEPMMVSGCKAGLTRERTEQLRALVEFDG